MANPRIAGKKPSRIRFGWREAIILMSGGALMVACNFLNWDPDLWMPLRIGLAVLIGDIALVWAFGRDPVSGTTIEQFIWQSIKGAFFLQKNSASSDASSDIFHLYGPKNLQEINRWQQYVRPEAPSLWTFQPIRINSMLLLQAFSYATLAAIIAWLVTGGTQEVIRWMQLSFR
jgi:hypothetical protein